jgi:hypothetical protein
MATPLDPQLLAVAGAGLVGGLGLLARGFVGYRRASQITDTSPSRIASIAVGEVLVSGVVEPAELTLISPLQSATCVFYRSRIEESNGSTMANLLNEERAVGFRIRDETGSLRVFPRGARFDIPLAFDEKSSALGGEPIGLMMRAGSAFAAAAPDREAQIAALLTVHQPAGSMPSGGESESWRGFAGDRLLGGTNRGSRARHYREARLEPGDVITVVGEVLPYDQLPDPLGANQHASGDPLLDDPEIATDLAAARAAGILETDPAEAWGNAAIPGFGMGRPVRAPELDDAATDPPLAAPTDAARFEQTFAIAPDALVLAASGGVPLVIAGGPPTVAAARQERLFLIGLLGAILAIGAAMAMAAMVGGGIGGA